MYIEIANTIVLLTDFPQGEEEEEGEGEEMDDWMVPHGYLSEDEGCQDDDEVYNQFITYLMYQGLCVHESARC